MLPNIRPHTSGVQLGRQTALFMQGTNDPTLDPATVPSRKDPQMGEFWTLRYSVAGAFTSPA